MTEEHRADSDRLNIHRYEILATSPLNASRVMRA